MEENNYFWLQGSRDFQKVNMKCNPYAPQTFIFPTRSSGLQYEVGVWR